TILTLSPVKGSRRSLRFVLSSSIRRSTTTVWRGLRCCGSGAGVSGFLATAGGPSCRRARAVHGYATTARYPKYLRVGPRELRAGAGSHPSAPEVVTAPSATEPASARRGDRPRSRPVPHARLRGRCHGDATAGRGGALQLLLLVAEVDVLVLRCLVVIVVPEAAGLVLVVPVVLVVPLVLVVVPVVVLVEVVLFAPLALVVEVALVVLVLVVIVQEGSPGGHEAVHVAGAVVATDDERPERLRVDRVQVESIRRHLCPPVRCALRRARPAPSACLGRGPAPSA